MKKLTALLLTVILLLTLLTACGASSSTVRYESAAQAPAMEITAADTAVSGAGVLTEEAGSDASASLPEDRKWIITVYMDAETEALDTLLTALDQRIAELEGYVEDQSVYNGSTYSSRRYRSASLTIRIPAQQVEAFTEAVSGIANVVSNNMSREDITLTYVATESKITALETEEARLLELLAQAETMADLLEIEARLSDVRYELESYSSRLRVYDNQVDYATVHLSIEEVQEYTPVAEKTLWERIRDGFLDSLEGLGEGFVDFFVWVIVTSPYLVVWGLLLTGAFFLARRLKRRIPRERKPKKSPFQKKQDDLP